jgi:hypothetical protein
MTAARCRRVLAAFALLMLPGTAVALAQEPAPPLEPERLTPLEVVRLFDAYAVVQAQEALGLETERYGTFVAQYRALLDARRRHQEARLRALAELGRLTRGRGRAVDEQVLRDRLRALEELDARGTADVRAAHVTLEQSLTVLQQAKFRVFEEQMERRKLQLLARARQPGPGRRVPGIR